MSFDVDQSEVAAAMESAPEQGTQSTQSPESTASSAQPGQQGAAKEAAIAEAVAELEKLGKFKFQGKEWTPEDLKKAILRQEDYTRKTQKLSEEAKYQKSLYWDLESVRKNPQLAAQFRQLYPKDYHGYVDQVLAETQNTGLPTQGQQSSPNASEPKYLPIDPDVAERFEKVEAYVREKEVSAIESQLETWDTKFSDKYKLADQESVYAKADALYAARKAEDPNFKFTENLWEQLYKADHDRHTQRYEGHYRALQKSQLDAGLKGRDVASGGGTPSQGPKQYRTIREATNAALEELSG